jgi:hypothetical protein
MEIAIMPKKGIYLPPRAVEAIKTHIEQRGIVYETFAKKTLKVSVRTLHNWLASKNAIDQEKLDLLIKELGIGVEDLFGEQLPEEYRARDDMFPTLRLMYETGVALTVKNAYSNVAKLFWQHISFNKFPKTGYFKTFEHDISKRKNYYCQIWLIPEEEVEEITFTFSFTIFNILRITYGEVILKKDCVELKQYYQPPNYIIVERPSIKKPLVKAATWFDEANHTFIISSNVKFKLENKGYISEMDLRHTDDVAVFWKHFFFHPD